MEAADHCGRMRELWDPTMHCCRLQIWHMLELIAIPRFIDRENPHHPLYPLHTAARFAAT